MKVDIRDVREHPVELEVDCAPEALELEDPEFSFPDKVKGAVVFSTAGDKIVARGRLETTIESDCVRCLKKVRTPLRAPVDIVYEAQKDPVSPEQEVFGSSEGDERIAYFTGDTIRPEAQLREALMIELPGLPVCDAACKGLCPKCGTDLNEETCRCEISDVEQPSWKSALKNLKLES